MGSPREDSESDANDEESHAVVDEDAQEDQDGGGGDSGESAQVRAAKFNYD